MKLYDFLSKIYENSTIWIGLDPENSEGVYFGAARDVTVSVAKKYEVVEFYVERYPAIGGLFGISIIVREVT